ncbi:unnamed protein product, partial [Discosporangium mesarthrocarpum]
DLPRSRRTRCALHTFSSSRSLSWERLKLVRTTHKKIPPSVLHSSCSHSFLTHDQVDPPNSERSAISILLGSRRTEGSKYLSLIFPPHPCTQSFCYLVTVLAPRWKSDHTGEAENEGYGVTAGANAWDQRGADNNGCTVDGVDGCRPELTRDFELNFDPNSRWSCSESLGVDTCQLYFDFGSPVELINVRIGFHKGDQRKRTIKFWNGDVGDESLGTYTSSGSTLGYDVFPVTTDSKNVHRLTIQGRKLKEDEWLSITKVR